MDSKSRVVLPLPETPLTTVNFPLGIFIAISLTLWISEVLISISPFSKILSDLSLMMIFSELVKNGAICEEGLFTISSKLPLAIMLPPSAPAFGPSSII